MNISQPPEENTIGEEELFLSSFLLRQETIYFWREDLCVQVME